MTRDQADQIARDFMDSFEGFRECSLDEFMYEYGDSMTQKQRERGYDILSWYPEYGGVEFEGEAE
jgi:hypothetical protein